MYDPGLKQCSTCEVWFERKFFRKDKHNPDGLQYHCKTCKSKIEKEYNARRPEVRKAINDSRKDKRRSYYERHKDKFKSAQLQRDFGISLEKYDEMLTNQNGVCYICKQEETSIRNRRLAVDHNHETGKIRGLLCSHCNRALGLFKDSKELLIAAFNYLENTDEK